MIFRYSEKKADIDQQALSHLMESCAVQFNSFVAEEFFKNDNLIVAFFVPSEGVKVYEEICSKYCPSHLDEDYRSAGYMESFVALALPGKPKNAIMVRVDQTNVHPTEWRHLILHEMAHIYCAQNEFGGKNFYQEHCADDEGDVRRNGIINAGYAVWREFIADYMAVVIDIDYIRLTIPQLKTEVKNLSESIYWGNPNAKTAASILLAYILTSKAVRRSENFDEAFSFLQKHKFITDDNRSPFFYAMVELCYQRTHSADFYRIDLDFIMKLGRAYLSVISGTKFLL